MKLRSTMDTSPINIDMDTDDASLSKKQKTTNKENNNSADVITNHFPKVTQTTPTSTQTSPKSILKNTARQSPPPAQRTAVTRHHTYVYLVFDVPPSGDHIAKYRTVLASFVTAMRDADPMAVLTPYEIVPVQDPESGRHTHNDRFIETPARLPTSITQLQKYFFRGRPQKLGGTVFTNVLIGHDEDIKDIMLDIKECMEQYNLKIGQQRVQHPEVIKLGYILYLTPKIDLQAWTDFLKQELRKIMSQPLYFALTISKINDGLGFQAKKRTPSGRASSYSKGKDNMAVHVETIKSQQLHMKRALDKVLATCIPPERYGIDLRLMPQIKYDMDTHHKDRLRGAAIKHKQVMANLVDLKMNDLDTIDSPIRSLKNKTLRQLIMNLASASGEKLFIAIERSWQGDNTLWAKRKYREEASVYASHLPAWLVSLHGDAILTKLSAEAQDLVKSVKWRNGVPLYPEEAEIEDVTSQKIGWLIDVDDISISSGRGANPFEEDDLSVSTMGSKSFFEGRTLRFQEEESDQESKASQPETLRGTVSTASTVILDYTDNTTIDETVRDSQSVGGYGMPPAPI